LRPLAALAAVSLLAVAASCGGDDDDSSPTTAAPATTAAAATTAPAAETTTPAGSATTGPDAAPTTVAADVDPLAPKPLAERQKLTVAVAGYKAEGYSPLFLADHLGEFDKENLDVEVKVINPGDALVALDAGQVDVYAAGFLANIFNAITSGSDFKWIASVHHNPPTSGMGFWARTELMTDGTLDPCSLKGKTISLGGATGYAGAGSWPMGDFLAKCDLDLKDFNLSTLGGADLVIAMEQGAVDVGFLADPAWVPLKEAGTAELAIKSYEEPPGGYIAGKAITEQPEALTAFVRALLRVVRDDLQGEYKQDPAIVDALAGELEIPADTLASLPSLIFEPTMTIDPKPIDEMQAIWYETGDILTGEPIPSSDVIDMSFVERALAGQ
jgi:NitT/TauT family transport system substrate-binding protein